MDYQDIHLGENWAANGGRFAEAQHILRATLLAWNLRSKKFKRDQQLASGILEAIEFIAADELVEVTPRSIRLRKKIVEANKRPRRHRPGP